MTKIKIIACQTVIQEMLEFIPEDVETHTLESGLHLKPEKLREALQAMINDFTAETETFILGYGMCSMGVVGLSAEKSTLIVPRLDDCVSIFLGSRENYKKVMDQEPGTYFLSKGWIEAGISLLEELNEMEVKYGKKQAARLMKRMIQHYKRLAYIDMDYNEQGDYQEYSRKVADKFDLRYEEVKGSPAFLKKIINGPWDDDFIIALPGHVITLEDFQL